MSDQGKQPTKPLNNYIHFCQVEGPKLGPSCVGPARTLVLKAQWDKLKAEQPEEVHEWTRKAKEAFNRQVGGGTQHVGGPLPMA